MTTSKLTPCNQIANLADIFTSRLLAEIPPALDALLQSLLALPGLHTVDLSDNAFGFNTIDPLRSFLSQHTPLQHLILSNNGLGPESGVIIATALTELAEKKKKKKKEENKKSTKDVDEGQAKAKDDDTSTITSASSSLHPPLETIICGRNRLENGSMKAWAAAFAANDQVRTVRLPQNGIRPAGLAALIHDGLAKVKQLTLLDLQDNTMTSEGARALAASLPGWRNLEELGVGDCLLGARGSEWVVKALEKGENEMLEVLRLQYNEVRAKGVRDLADAFSKVPKLRRVELNGNQFDEEDEGLEELRIALDGRKEKAGDGSGDVGEEYWGLDDLDDLEEPDDEDEDGDEGSAKEDEEEDAEEVKNESEKEVKKNTVDLADRIDKDLKTTDEAEEQNVAQKQDKSVDDLADRLSKTGL